MPDSVKKTGHPGNEKVTDKIVTTPAPPEISAVQQLTWPEVQKKMKGPKVALIDVRTEEKHQHSPIGGKNIPVDQLDSRAAELKAYDEVIFYCTSGNKSTRAAEKAEELLPGVKVYSLLNGVSSLGE